MEFYTDFKDFIKLLNKNKVKYLVVGGYAISFHSRPKGTQDIDIFIETSKENAKKVLKVLDDFGFENLNLSISDLISENQIIQIGFPPIRIDIMTSIEGINFGDAFKNRVESIYGDIENVPFISFDDLINNKKKVGRKKDLNDIDWLNKYRNKK